MPIQSNKELLSILSQGKQLKSCDEVSKMIKKQVHLCSHIKTWAQANN